MKKKDLLIYREKDLKEVLKSLSEKRMEAKKAQVEMFGGKEKNLKKVRNLRKEIAQILTILKERELIEESSKV